MTVDNPALSCSGDWGVGAAGAASAGETWRERGRWLSAPGSRSARMACRRVSEGHQSV